MSQPLMPKATAVWLVDNTTLTFDQIAAFCNLHPLEVQGIADGEVAAGIKGLDPISTSQLTQEEIDRCIADPSGRLRRSQARLREPERRSKGPRYTPLSRRQDRPNAIAWLVRYHPELADAQISKLVGTTKQTIQAVRERTHWNMANITPQDPVTLGLSSQVDLDTAVQKAQAKLQRQLAKEEKEKAKQRAASLAAAEQAGMPSAQAEPEESTAEPEEGTAEPEEGTAEPEEGTAEPVSEVAPSEDQTPLASPVAEPPADEPPADEPPADEPPADEPPADEPPADEPPADEPAAAEETTKESGAADDEPRAEDVFGTS
jgi:hypothetical protein